MFAPMKYEDRKPQKENKNIIYGMHAVLEALDAGTELNKVIMQKGLAKSDQSEMILKLAKAQKVPVQFVPKEMSLFPYNKNHQGVMAFMSPIIYQKLENVLPQLFEEGKVPLFFYWIELPMCAISEPLPARHIVVEYMP
jgi:23S rRNA (guanosine2251-2'-O)-methyltransferase